MDKTNYTYVTTTRDLDTLRSLLGTIGLISLDLETTSLDPHIGKIRLLSIGIPLTDGVAVYVVDCFKVDPTPLYDSLRAWLGQGGRVIGHGLNFDYKWLLHHGKLDLQPNYDPNTSNIFDTHRASQLIYNGLDKPGGVEGHNLWSLYKRELNLDPGVADLGGSNWASGDLSTSQLDYAADDVTQLHLLRDKLKDRLVKEGLVRTGVIEFNVVGAESSIELNGFKLDAKAWLELAERNKKEAFRIREELLCVLPHPQGQLGLFGAAPWNLESNPQLLKSLKKLGLEPRGVDKDTGKLKPSTSKEALATLGHPVAALLRQYREVEQRVSTFGEAYVQEHLHPKTKRLHTHLWPFSGAGRYNFANPNLGQIPREDAYRSCFIAESGNVLVVRDYSQIEIRIMAEISRDPKLRTIYQKGLDVYLETAKLITGKKDIDKKGRERQEAKAVVLGFIYGMGHERFQVYARTEFGVELTLEQCLLFRQAFFLAYKTVRRFHYQITDDKAKQLPARTLSGRLRYLDLDSFSDRINTPVQGSGADILKTAMARTYHALKAYPCASHRHQTNARLVNCPHDELVVECPKEIAEEVEMVMDREMVAAAETLVKDVPVVTSGGIGDNWADAK